MDDPPGTRGQTITDPDGRLVELPARVWRSKILRDHPELVGWHAEVLATVQAPDHIEPDPLPQRRRFYRRGLGPSRWLLVVVTYEQNPARIITALANRKDPEQWTS